MGVITIRSQRLVDAAGETCDRCAGTGDEVETAVNLLRVALAPLGITVVAETKALTVSEFLQSPLESNRVWIGERPLEDWLHAEVGSSDCCGPCGDNDCRTVSVKGTNYEVVPKGLILKAGLLAAAELIH